MNLVKKFKTFHLIIPSHPSPESTRTWTIVWILIWSSYPTLFIRLQGVSQDDQFFDTPHLIILSYPIRLQTVRELAQLFECSLSNHPILFSSSVSRTYVNLDNYLNTPYLIISSHPSPESTRTWSIDWIIHIWSSYPILSSPPYVNLINYSKASDQTIPSSTSLGCMWTWSIVQIPPHLIISFHTCPQKVRELC